MQQRHQNWVQITSASLTGKHHAIGSTEGRHMRSTPASRHVLMTETREPTCLLWVHRWNSVHSFPSWSHKGHHSSQGKLWEWGVPVFKAWVQRGWTSNGDIDICWGMALSGGWSQGSDHLPSLSILVPLQLFQGEVDIECFKTINFQTEAPKRILPNAHLWGCSWLGSPPCYCVALGKEISQHNKGTNQRFFTTQLFRSSCVVHFIKKPFSVIFCDNLFWSAVYYQ